MDQILEMGQAVLAAQPFSMFMGAELVEFRQGYAELTLPLRPEYLQQHGGAHGGVVSYVADNAISFAAGSVLGPSILTLEYKINYLRQAKGERLIGRATVLGSGTRQAVCRCDVWVVGGDEEVLCASAQGTIVTFGG